MTLSERTNWWTHGAFRLAGGKSTVARLVTATLLVAAGCAVPDFKGNVDSPEEPVSAQETVIDERERLDPVPSDGPIGRDPDGLPDEEDEVFLSGGGTFGRWDLDAEDADIPEDLMCPWSNDDCLDNCRVSERSYDPCEGATVLSGGTLRDDTVWDGRYCVEGEVSVGQGVTLTIEPGSEIYFAATAMLEVEGHLYAVGTDEAPILLSARTVIPTEMRWRGIHIMLTEGGTLVLRDATVEHASWGVATWEHASDPTFAGPETTVDIRETLFRFNMMGVAPDDNTVLTHSTFVCNWTGIFVASEDDPIQDLRGNNLCHNFVDVRAQQDGADVSDSWWCTTDLSEIEARTEDDRDSIELGMLVLEPFRNAPVPEAPPVP
jgi:hypothetical protein